MKHGHTIASARKMWAELVAKDNAPDTAQLRAARHDITLRFRTLFPNKKSYGNQYPWNSPKFDHYINPN